VVRNLDYSSLRAAIAKEGVTNRHLANCLELSEQAFSNKVSGRTEFKNSEIKILAKELNLNMTAINSIFFDNTVN
jgi:ribosome-binding protein aMBF1 (putative translation factor)